MKSGKLVAGFRVGVGTRLAMAKSSRSHRWGKPQKSNPAKMEAKSNAPDPTSKALKDKPNPAYLDGEPKKLTGPGFAAILMLL
ncbi:MAG TPA: hypothetical protein VFQ41_08100 [Candidatus Angelobacter sp.]|nr:hypothetical protein [Candidatus Angelobacter sp.]